MNNKTHNHGSSILDGKILPVTLRIGLPFLLSNAATYLYSIADTAFLSLLSRESSAIISGVSLIFPVYMFFMALANGLGIGISSFIARGIGEKNAEKLSRGFPSVMAVAIILVLLTLVPAYLFQKKIIALLAGTGLSPASLQAANDYLFYLLPAFGLLLLGYPMMGIFWGEGKTFQIGVITVISYILNIILDPIFIFRFNMGVAGAALATTLSIACTAFYVITLFIMKKTNVPVAVRISKIKSTVVKEISKIGLTQVLGMLSLSAAMGILNNLVSSIGQKEMNAWGLCNRLDQIVLLPVYAISGATLTMLGQNYGTGNWRRIKKIFVLNTLCALAGLIPLSVIYMAGAPFFLTLFSGLPDVVALGARQIYIVTLSLTGVALEIMAISSFQGMKLFIPPVILIALRLFVLELPLAFLFSRKLIPGLNGILTALVVSHILTGIISVSWITKHISAKGITVREEFREA